MQALLEQQSKSKSRLEKVKVGAFFMEPGTGKTRPCVELIQDINPDYVLYIAPYQCINASNYSESTRHEIEKWGGFNCDWDLVAVETIQASDRTYLNLHKKLQKSTNAVIVCDESIKIKNINSKRTKRLLELSKLSEFRYILNGTPITRNLYDLYPQMEFLSPSILAMPESEFKNSFVEWKKITIRKPGTYKAISREWIVKYHNLDYLYELIKPYVFQANLELNVGLQEIPIYYELSNDEKEEHKRIMEEILSDEWLMAKPNFFLQLTQKLQNNYSRNEEKFVILGNILKENPDTLVVAKYIETQDELKHRFPNARILSWQKNAFGLNLQQYNKMLLFDQHWDYALFDQIIKRIFRTGQKHDCIVWRLVGDCGLEKMMWNNVDKKADMLNEFKKLSKEELIKELI